ncbi:hypothetical protein [Roseiconus lacunae]|uniref:hypothetical protein n=1 Tax=Roseiconus lacunae TaxID=2605694 RepID=UPI001E3C76AB|nr:hypothetical protein [Roseiconus lacunae]MCD0458656.1 hypothetical protein [Roseiconus lacunae]
MEPLNPRLHNALKDRFGAVKISNPGERYIPSTALSRSLDGRSPPPRQSGEYYRVCCPECGDTKYRLYINHMFGSLDDDNSGLHLMNCYNERCFKTLQDRRWFWGRLFPFNYDAKIMQTQQQPLVASSPGGGVAAITPVPVQLPAGYQLSDPAAHHAVVYLQQRGFDPAELASLWSVYYCQESQISSPPLSNRVVLPVVNVRRSPIHGVTSETVGWQARAIDSQLPKYLSMRGFPKSKYLYGIQHAKQWDCPLVVVEGATDVWRFGGSCVALLGKSASSSQRQQLTTQFQDRPICIALDRDAAQEASQLVRELTRARADWDCHLPVYSISPPDGRDDFAECSREEAWGLVMTHLSGCQVSVESVAHLQARSHTEVRLIL